jgi:hypothetical protein
MSRTLLVMTGCTPNPPTAELHDTLFRFYLNMRSYWSPLGDACFLILPRINTLFNREEFFDENVYTGDHQMYFEQQIKLLLRGADFE